MPKALILVADGSEEIEFVTPYDGEWSNLIRNDYLISLTCSLQFSLEPATKSHLQA
jgi:hypothetical protein